MIPLIYHYHHHLWISKKNNSQSKAIYFSVNICILGNKQKTGNSCTLMFVNSCATITCDIKNLLNRRRWTNKWRVYYIYICVCLLFLSTCICFLSSNAIFTLTMTMNHFHDATCWLMFVHRILCICQSCILRIFYEFLRCVKNPLDRSLINYNVMWCDSLCTTHKFFRRFVDFSFQLKFIW